MSQEIYSTSQARERFADILNSVEFKGERVLVGRRGKTVAAVISAADLELLECLEDRLDLETIRQRLAEENGEAIPWDDVKSEAGL